MPEARGTRQGRGQGQMDTAPLDGARRTGPSGPGLKFRPEACGAIVGSLRAGLSLKEACVRADLAESSVKRWLTRGRKESVGPYADFARDVDAAREEAAGSVMSLEEFQGHVNAAVRAGSVQAMKLWFEVHRVDARKDPEAPADPMRRFDELREKREQRAV